MAHRLSLEAAAELDEIWYYIARESRSVARANRVIDALTARFYLLASFPHIGRRRDDLRPGLRSFPAGDYVVVYRVEKADVLILHGRRDIVVLLREDE